MNIEVLSNNIKIYVYIGISKDSDIRSTVKSIINKLKDKLGMSGYYECYVYYRCGILFIDAHKTSKGLYMDDVELKLILDDDKDVYFRTSDYFVARRFSSFKFIDGYFYSLVNDSISNILEVVEFGKFVFGH